MLTIDRTAQTFPGNPQPEPDVLLLHTTEVWGWPGYQGGGTAPHATVKPIPGQGITVREHRPVTDYAKALENDRGGPETNKRGVWQLELMGTCDPRRRADMYYWPDADDAVLGALADYCRPVMARYAIPAQAMAEFVAYPASYGDRAPQRLTPTQWTTRQGIAGHSSVPENAHGDPGAFPIARFIALLTHQEDDEMPLTKDDARTLLTMSAIVKDTRAANPETAPRVTASTLLEYAAATAKATAAKVDALSAAAPAPGLPVERLEAIWREECAKRLDEVTVTDGGAP